MEKLQLAYKIGSVPRKLPEVQQSYGKGQIIKVLEKFKLLNILAEKQLKNLEFRIELTS